MSIYTFEKKLYAQRLNEFKMILEEDENDVKKQWKEVLETSLEPAGYSAIWKISRMKCEQLKIKFPCEVLGVVRETFFDQLSAHLTIEQVQDENLHLPALCLVPLEDLYPTVEQENPALNVDLTADILDRFRFFFKYIFMPFDEINSGDFLCNHLQPRMNLFFDLKSKKMSKGLSSHIRKMISEANHIHSLREDVENSFDLESPDISHGEAKEKARQLLQLHLRMNMIKHELDILVNPEMRNIYEEVKFGHQADAKIFAVVKPGTLQEQFEVLKELQKKVADDQEVHWLSLGDAIAAATAFSEIYIPAGGHTVSFLEYLNDNVLLCGLPLGVDKYAKISAAESGSMLFAVDGDLRLQHLLFDCSNVKTGFVVKSGKLSIKNCTIEGTKESSVTEAFSISGDTEVDIDNCVISDFATGISISGAARVNIRNSTLKNCNVGVNLLDDESAVSIENSSILNCDEFGVLKYSDGDEGKALDWNDKSAAEP